jgi:predicted solute-binding protein
LNSVCIGCVKYLNARPLIRGWPGNVEFDHPSTLCKRLANGEIDVALVSSFEFLRNPIYRIADGISISSDGPVYSVVVAHRDKIFAIKEIELDPASQTAVNLLRCLLAELSVKPRLIRNTDLQSVRATGLKPAVSKTAENISTGRTGNMPVFQPPAGSKPAVSAPVQSAESQIAENISSGHTGNMPTFPAVRRARLLIGDQAIHFRQRHADEFQFWDLGEQWKKLTGLPFVYALWLIRPEVVDPKQIADRLRVLRNENLGDLDELIAAEKQFDPQFCSHYYRNNLRFGLGEKEKEGLRTFAQLCAKNGLLPKRDIPFDLV